MPSDVSITFKKLEGCFARLVGHWDNGESHIWVEQLTCKSMDNWIDLEIIWGENSHLDIDLVQKNILNKFNREALIKNLKFMGITKLKYRANTGKDEDLELSQ